MQEAAKEFDYDYIIVGSGFGGSVSALRLSQKGYKVLVVEKGKWYKAEDFPKTNWQLRKWLWVPGLRFFGIMKVTLLRHVSIISGAGVGGGSLVYANTLPRPKSEFFNSGNWKGLADWESELDTHYEEALRMLGAEKTPRLFDADKSLKELASVMGREEHFHHTNVAVYFGKPGVKVEDPYFNGEGPTRTGCVYCGGCMTGCRYNSKNTLDKNYLYFAERLGAEILAENEVVDIVPLDGNAGETGYRVGVKTSTRVFSKSRSFETRGVVFSGGVLGTLKLMLKLKKKSLPRLSGRLGLDIRTNNETLVSVTSLDERLDMSKGVAIGSILNTDDDSHLEVVRYAEGSGFWKLLHFPKSFKTPLSYLKVYFARPWAKSTAVLLFMQTLDSTLRFKLNALGGISTKVSTGNAPTPNIPASRQLTEKFSSIVNGKPTSFLMETLSGTPSTAHILGGAVMGEDASKGVIDKNNHVFGYQNMLVVDGSMISSNPGVNPSLSITAIAERCMSLVKQKN
jgi:cholesterol oxidase